MKRGVLALALVLATKSAKLVKVVKLLKVLKFTKPLVTFVSMGISTIVYSFLLGPWFALAFVLMLFIHEMGHVVALRIKGMPTPGPVFIPLLGAVIFAPPFRSRRDEAFIGIAGPVAGAVAAFAAYGLWLALPEKSEILLLASYVGAYINLFNLIPLRPLDGGRTTQIIGEWFKYVGIAMMLAFTIYVREPGMLLLWIIFLWEMEAVNAWLRVTIGVTCEIAMAALMLAGYGEQHVIGNVIDVLFATFINFTLVAKAKKLVADEPNLPEEPVLLSHRLAWLGGYVLLAAVLVLLMLHQIPHLPAGAKG